MNKEMTEAARNAFLSGQPSAFMWSSALDMAHRTGLWLHTQGFMVPSMVRMSRGYKVRAKSGAVEVILDFGPDSKSPVRIA